MIDSEQLGAHVVHAETGGVRGRLKSLLQTSWRSTCNLRGSYQRSSGFPPHKMSAGLLKHPCFNSNTIEDAVARKSFRKSSSCSARSVFGSAGSISSLWCWFDSSVIMDPVKSLRDGITREGAEGKLPVVWGGERWCSPEREARDSSWQIRLPGIIGWWNGIREKAWMRGETTQTDCDCKSFRFHGETLEHTGDKRPFPITFHKTCRWREIAM